MTNPATYRSVVHDLVALIENQYGDRISKETLDSALGIYADVYRQAKSLTTDEPTPTMFVSMGEGGAYNASITNSGLSDITVVVVDETKYDKDGTLLSISRDDGTVFSAKVKMLIPNATEFDADRVLEVAKREPVSNSLPFYSGIELAINTFLQWKEDSRPDHYKLLKTASDAISEHGFDAYSDYLLDALVEFKAGMLARAKKREPLCDEAANEVKLMAWMKETFSDDEPEMAIAAAVYERGIDRVMESFETKPVSGPSI